MGQAYALPVVSPNADVQPYAGFWLRFAAYLIDSIVLFVIQMVLAAAVILMDPGDLRAFLNVAPVGWALTWAYFAVLESSPLQGTVGKHALGLYVADVYGDPIGLGRRFGRANRRRCDGSFVLLRGFRTSRPAEGRPAS